MLFSKGKLEKFKNFNQNIQNCSDVVFELKPSDICINKNKCEIFSEIEENSFKIRLKKTIVCTCKNEKKNKFNCGKQFCSVHKEACRQFYLEKEKMDLKNIQNCLHNF